MARTTQRREQICAAAIELLASGGGHALSHQAIDRHLRLPAGSTSYYFRTRRALLVATIEALAERSRDAFQRAEPERVLTLDAASAFIAEQLAALLGERRAQALARYALVSEAGDDPELAGLLAGGLFSQERAVLLCDRLGIGQPDAVAADLSALLEGLLFDHLHGRRRWAAEAGSAGVSEAELRRPIRALLAGSASEPGGPVPQAVGLPG